MCASVVPGPRLISPICWLPSPRPVTLPATWNSLLHLGLLKKARQPKWRTRSQWLLTCPVARCKIRAVGEWGVPGVAGDIMLLRSQPTRCSRTDTAAAGVVTDTLCFSRRPCDKSAHPASERGVRYLATDNCWQGRRPSTKQTYVGEEGKSYRSLSRWRNEAWRSIRFQSTTKTTPKITTKTVCIYACLSDVASDLGKRNRGKCEF